VHNGVHSGMYSQKLRYNFPPPGVEFANTNDHKFTPVVSVPEIYKSCGCSFPQPQLQVNSFLIPVSDYIPLAWHSSILK